MSAGRAVIDNDGIPFSIVNPGDIVLLGEVATALTTAGAGTITGAMFATGLTVRSGQAGATNDTTDTAANIIAAIGGNVGSPTVVPGTTFRWRYINTVAGSVLTLVAGTGVTLDTTTVPNAVTTVAASSMKDFLVTILNASPASIFPMTTTNANAVLSFVINGAIGSRGFPPNGTMTVTPGQAVSGTNIPAGATVIGVNLGVGGAIGVTISANATGTITAASGGTAITFGPAVKITPISGSTAILT